MWYSHLYIHQIVIMMQLLLLCHWAVRGDAVDPKEEGHWFGGHHDDVAGRVNEMKNPTREKLKKRVSTQESTDKPMTFTLTQQLSMQKAAISS